MRPNFQQLENTTVETSADTAIAIPTVPVGNIFLLPSCSSLQAFHHAGHEPSGGPETAGAVSCCGCQQAQDAARQTGGWEGGFTCCPRCWKKLQDSDGSSGRNAAKLGCQPEGAEQV